MRSLVTLLTAAAVLAEDASFGGGSHALFVEEERKVRNTVAVLNASNFDNVLLKHPASLVFFYAKWCDYSKNLMPVYKSAARKLNSSFILLAKVDCEAEGELAVKHSISGYPTLLVFNFGRRVSEIVYDAQNDEEEIVLFMRGVLHKPQYYMAYLHAYFMYKRRVRSLPIIGELQKEYLFKAFPWVVIPMLVTPYLIFFCCFGEKKKQATGGSDGSDKHKGHEGEAAPPNESQGKKQQ